MEKPKKPFIFRAWMISNLRRGFKRYPPYYNTLNAAKTTYFIESKNGKQLKRVSFKCNKCAEQFKNKEVVVDHIIPVIDLITGFPLNKDGTDDWTTFLTRLYCAQENLQVLCKPCHGDKTGKETKQRAKSRKKKLQIATRNSNIKKGKKK